MLPDSSLVLNVRVGDQTLQLPVQVSVQNTASTQQHTSGDMRSTMAVASPHWEQRDVKPVMKKTTAPSNMVYAFECF